MRTVKLKPGHAKPLWHGHPWVFAKSIASASSDAGPGPADWTRVEDETGRLVGYGLWSGGSAIRVRLLLGRDAEAVDQPNSLLAERIHAAAALRATWFPEGGDTDTYRVVHAEADGLPGLVVDRYGDWLVAQWATRPLYDRREVLGQVLLDATGARGLVSRAAGHEEREQIPDDGPTFRLGAASPESVIVSERGLRLEVQPQHGQKTGHYTDQRENRVAVAAYARGHEVLDLFCGSGGFALHALRAGATRAIGVDSGKRAIEVAQRNADLNGLADRFEAERCDVAEALAALKAEERRFGLVVCDPPNLIPTRDARARAVRPWRELLVRSLTRTEAKGFLAAFSCTPRMDSAGLLELLHSAARDCRRPFRVLAELGAGPDHPVLPQAASSRYLSGYIVQALPW